VRAGPSSERAVILAPRGRDASVAAVLIREAGYHAQICSDLAALTREIEGGAGLALIADEAMKTADLRGLVNWLNGQPPWSDFPIVLLTHQGGGPSAIRTPRGSGRRSATSPSSSGRFIRPRS
jgi:DNA-binding transcriptional LysR family regulator